MNRAFWCLMGLLCFAFSLCAMESKRGDVSEESMALDIGYVRALGFRVGEVSSAPTISPLYCVNSFKQFLSNLRYTVDRDPAEGDVNTLNRALGTEIESFDGKTSEQLRLARWHIVDFVGAMQKNLDEQKNHLVRQGWSEGTALLMGRFPAGAELICGNEVMRRALEAGFAVAPQAMPAGPEKDAAVARWNEARAAACAAWAPWKEREERAMAAMPADNFVGEKRRAFSASLSAEERREYDSARQGAEKYLCR